MTRILLAAIALGSVLPCMAAELATRQVLTLATAKKIAAAAEAEALKNKWTVVIAIVDEGGHTMYLQRLDDTQLASIEIAQKKARTSLMYKRPTKADRVRRPA